MDTEGECQKMVPRCSLSHTTPDEQATAPPSTSAKVSPGEPQSQTTGPHPSPATQSTPETIPTSRIRQDERGSLGLC